LYFPRFTRPVSTSAPVTPTMEAGLTNHVSEIEELLALLD
jgi:hypothetical protein